MKVLSCFELVNLEERGCMELRFGGSLVLEDLRNEGYAMLSRNCQALLNVESIPLTSSSGSLVEEKQLTCATWSNIRGSVLRPPHLSLWQGLSQTQLPYVEEEILGRRVELFWSITEGCGSQPTCTPAPGVHRTSQVYELSDGQLVRPAAGCWHSGVSCKKKHSDFFYKFTSPYYTRAQSIQEVEIEGIEQEDYQTSQCFYLLYVRHLRTWQYNIRVGGEYASPGTKCAAEYLIQEKHTIASHIAINGVL
ncbi:prolyl endopeptidase-like protein [Lates japonicus]|uniref:Prolyl endopeptidase-like protein n=1 Tax=Lates japonicus TaxID=270547 RepID=A0AAD3RLQ1_LATJO|nr:prolyl endopeptidase-like protein [Lates japonicus]